MNKMLLISVSILGLTTVGAVAGQPDDPGGFGRDRADYIQEHFLNGGDMDTAPGASEWGQIARERAGTNGQVNRDYREQNGQTPTRGKNTTDDATTE